MKLKLYVTVAHPHQPGVDTAPDIFLAVHHTELEAMEDGLRAIDVLAERQKDTGLRYAIETLPVTMTVNLGWALLNQLLGLMRRLRRKPRRADAEVS